MNFVKNKVKKEFTSADLKNIAIVSMAVDHIGGIIIDGFFHKFSILTSAGLEISPNVSGYILIMVIYYLDIIFRLIGRIAFPLFAFLLVEGFIYTHSRKNYLLRLLLFALISQIPFSLAAILTGSSSRNVFFTLFLGFACIWGIDHIKEKSKNLIIGAIKIFLIIASCCLAAWYIDCDYGQHGVLCIIAFYLFKDKIYGALAASAILLLLNPIFEITAPFSILLINRYNGQKGKPSFGKYFFYTFYPIHIFIFYLIVKIL